MKIRGYVNDIKEINSTLKVVKDVVKNYAKKAHHTEINDHAVRKHLASTLLVQDTATR